MATTPPAAQTDFSLIITAHFARYPAMQLEDLYKLAHQACLGSEHAVSDRADTQQRLERELAQLGDGPAEPVVDPITPDGRIVRVHLRPFVAGGGDAAGLSDAFVRTASEYTGSKIKLRAYLHSIDDMIATAGLPFAPADARACWQRLETLEYPAVHHSSAFKSAYRPAYRVIAGEFLSGTLRTMDTN